MKEAIDFIKELKVFSGNEEVTGRILKVPQRMGNDTECNTSDMGTPQNNKGFQVSFDKTAQH